jgi:hypothetical protein
MNKIYIDSKELKKIDKKSKLRMDRINLVLENKL